MALCKSRFELLVAIQAPAVNAVTDDEIEMRGRKMTVERFERRNHVLLRAEAGRIRIGLDGPEILVREKKLLIVGGVPAATHEQNAFDPGVARVFREDVALHDDAVRGVEWRRQAQALAYNARGEAVFREERLQ